MIGFESVGYIFDQLLTALLDIVTIWLCLNGYHINVVTPIIKLLFSINLIKFHLIDEDMTLINKFNSFLTDQKLE